MRSSTNPTVKFHEIWGDLGALVWNFRKGSKWVYNFRPIKPCVVVRCCPSTGSSTSQGSRTHHKEELGPFVAGTHQCCEQDSSSGSLAAMELKFKTHLKPFLKFHTNAPEVPHICPRKFHCDIGAGSHICEISGPYWQHSRTYSVSTTHRVQQPAHHGYTHN